MSKKINILLPSRPYVPNPDAPSLTPLCESAHATWRGFYPQRTFPKRTHFMVCQLIKKKFKA